MKPIAHKGLSRGGFRLRDLIFVMGESEVHAAGMNVDGFSQILHSHGRALNVPARAAGTDARFPEKLAWFGRFPQSEIARIGLVVAIHIHPRPGHNTCRIHMAELSVIGKLRDAEVDGSVTHISKALGG